MIPFERSVYLEQVKAYLNEEKERLRNSRGT